MSNTGDMKNNSEVPQTTGTTDGGGNAGSTEQYNSSSGSRNRGQGKHKKQHYLELSNKDFEGETPEIGCVLGLRNEKITKKVPFDTFRDKIADFIVKKLDNAMDIMLIVK